MDSPTRTIDVPKLDGVKIVCRDPLYVTVDERDQFMETFDRALESDGKNRAAGRAADRALVQLLLLKVDGLPGIDPASFEVGQLPPAVMFTVIELGREVLDPLSLIPVPQPDSSAAEDSAPTG